MKKIFVLVSLLSLSLSSFAGSEIVMKCSVGKLGDYRGARINLLRTGDGILKANFIQGTTVSGTSYQVTTEDSLSFTGSIRNNTKFVIQLDISEIPTHNNFIRGFKASLQVVYPDLNNSSGMGVLKTTSADNFVCGEQTANFKN